MYDKGNYLEIWQIVPNPNYNRRAATNDVALLEMDGHFQWSDSVKPACLATSDFITEHKGQLMVSFRPFGGAN